MQNLTFYQPFSRFLQPVEGGFATVSTGFRVNIKEDEKEYCLSADLPGVNKNDVSVNVEDSVLSISAHFKLKQEDDAGTLYNERLDGSFERTFRLSDKIDADSIKAVMKDGVLTLTIPKAEHLAKRSITIG